MKLDKWAKAYSGMVMRNNRDGTFNVAMDDGERINNVHATKILSLKRGKKRPSWAPKLHAGTETAMFPPGTRAVLEAPRHVSLTDGLGDSLARGALVVVRQTLPKDRDGNPRYLVELVTDDPKRLASRVVLEGWMRREGLLATSSQVQFLCLEDLLLFSSPRGGFEIPLFQRRYCWGDAQWQPLWDCIVALVAAHRKDKGAHHSLKRLLCMVRPAGLVVLDGQQRLTTCCVLLAALRDAAATAGKAALSKRIAKLLVLPAVSAATGGACALRPTLDDRPDFHAALSSPFKGAGGGPLLRCRRFFCTRLAALPDARALERVCHACLRGLFLLLFPAAGAIQMQAVYEQHAASAAAQASFELQMARAWARDEIEMGQKGWGQLSDADVLEKYRKNRAVLMPHGIAEHGMAMSPVDLIRNYVFEFFDGEAVQRKAYTKYWVPMERACIAAGGADVSRACEKVFATALQKLLRKPVSVGGMVVYGAFQEWWEGLGKKSAEKRLAAFSTKIIKICM